MRHPASKASSFVIQYIAYLPLAGVTLSIYMLLKAAILQIILIFTKGSWVWLKVHQTMELNFLQILLDERLSSFRLQLVTWAAKMANTPALPVFLATALICFLLGQGLLAASKGLK
ncbi:MAG: hypothetical protein MI742_13905 [Desulfobacterales bacterium]|nr:hypothetical protein [Desulfobacterales bacterium]